MQMKLAALLQMFSLFLCCYILGPLPYVSCSFLLFVLVNFFYHKKRFAQLLNGSRVVTDLGRLMLLISLMPSYISIHSCAVSCQMNSTTLLNLMMDYVAYCLDANKSFVCHGFFFFFLLGGYQWFALLIDFEVSVKVHTNYALKCGYLQKGLVYVLR